jgi:hypothetical protein
VSEAFGAASLSLFGVYDDISVITSFFVDHFTDHITKSEHHVMFIDVGATFFKCFVENLTTDATGVRADLLGFDSSERAGELGLARALARLMRLGVPEARTLLKDIGADPQFADAELAEMATMVQNLVALSGGVDEFQIYGGASRLPFVERAITNVSGSALRRDLDATHGVLDATLHMIAVEKNLTDGRAIDRSAKPVWNLIIEWGNQTEKYCQKNAGCKYPAFTFRPGNDDIFIKVDPRQLPKGALNVVAHYRMTNASDIPYNPENPGRLVLQLPFPDPVLEYALYTDGTPGWKQIGIERIDSEPLDEVSRYCSEAFEESRRAVERKEIVGKIRNLVKKIKGVDAEEMKPYKQKLDDGTYKRMGTEELKNVLQKLETIATTMNIEDL